MRAEGWMNKAPIPTRTPLQIAQADFRHWSSRKRSILCDLEACEREWSEALERLEKLEQAESLRR